MLSEDEVNLNKGVSQLYAISTPGCMGWLAMPSGSRTCIIPSIVSVGIIHLYLLDAGKHYSCNTVLRILLRHIASRMENIILQGAGVGKHSNAHCIIPFLYNPYASVG